jgi:hypothetical protein
MREPPEPLETRLIRLEQVVGSLLTLLAACDIIGPEDFGRVREQLASRTSTPGPSGPPQVTGGPHHEEQHQRRPQAARRSAP